MRSRPTATGAFSEMNSRYDRFVRLGLSIAGALWIAISLFVYLMSAPSFDDVGQAWLWIEPIPEEEARVAMRGAWAALLVGLVVAGSHFAVSFWYTRFRSTRWMAALGGLLYGGLALFFGIWGIHAGNNAALYVYSVVFTAVAGLLLLAIGSKPHSTVM